MSGGEMPRSKYHATVMWSLAVRGRNYGRVTRHADKIDINMEEMDKSFLLFLYIDCGQATATRAQVVLVERYFPARKRSAIVFSVNYTAR